SGREFQIRACVTPRTCPGADRTRTRRDTGADLVFASAAARENEHGQIGPTGPQRRAGVADGRAVVEAEACGREMPRQTGTHEVANIADERPGTPAGGAALRGHHPRLRLPEVDIGKARDAQVLGG